MQSINRNQQILTKEINKTANIFQNKRIQKVSKGFSEARKSKPLKLGKRPHLKRALKHTKKETECLHGQLHITATLWCILCGVLSWYSPVQQTGKYLFQLAQTGITLALTDLAHVPRWTSLRSLFCFAYLAWRVTMAMFLQFRPPKNKQQILSGRSNLATLHRILVPNPRRQWSYWLYGSTTLVFLTSPEIHSQTLSHWEAHRNTCNKRNTIVQLAATVLQSFCVERLESLQIFQGMFLEHLWDCGPCCGAWTRHLDLSIQAIILSSQEGFEICWWQMENTQWYTK